MRRFLKFIDESNPQQARDPKGTTTGGQFTAHTRPLVHATGAQLRAYHQKQQQAAQGKKSKWFPEFGGLWLGNGDTKEAEFKKNYDWVVKNPAMMGVHYRRMVTFMIKSGIHQGGLGYPHINDLRKKLVESLQKAYQSYIAKAPTSDKYKKDAKDVLDLITKIQKQYPESTKVPSAEVEANKPLTNITLGQALKTVEPKSTSTPSTDTSTIEPVVPDLTNPDANVIQLAKDFNSYLPGTIGHKQAGEDLKLLGYDTAAKLEQLLNHPKINPSTIKIPVIPDQGVKPSSAELLAKDYATQLLTSDPIKTIELHKKLRLLGYGEDDVIKLTKDAFILFVLGEGAPANFNPPYVDPSGKEYWHWGDIAKDQVLKTPKENVFYRKYDNKTWVEKNNDWIYSFKGKYIDDADQAAHPGNYVTSMKSGEVYLYTNYTKGWEKQPRATTTAAPQEKYPDYEAFATAAKQAQTHGNLLSKSVETKAMLKLKAAVKYNIPVWTNTFQETLTSTQRNFLIKKYGTVIGAYNKIKKQQPLSSPPKSDTEAEPAKFFDKTPTPEPPSLDVSKLSLDQIKVELNKYTEKELTKAKKNVALQLQYVPNAPQTPEYQLQAQKYVDEFNKKWSGKEVPDDSAMLAKIADFNKLQHQITPLVNKEQEKTKKDNELKQKDLAKWQAQQTAKQAELAKQQQAALQKAKEEQKKKEAEIIAANQEIMKEFGISEVEAKAFLGLVDMQGGNSKNKLIDQFHKAASDAKYLGWNLTGFEAALIADYKSSSGVNGKLRNSPSWNAKWYLYSKVLNKALSKIPKYVGQVVRNTDLQTDVQQKYIVGNVVPEMGFTGTSDKLPDGVFNGGNTRYHITAIGKRAASIKEFHGFHGEGEVLFQARTLFHVDKVEGTPGCKGAKCFQVWMTELPDTFGNDE